MSRTLRGFDTAFPYLGARGDVTDADVPDPGLVAKEEAYGGMYFDIGDRVATEMFGADGDDFSFGAHDFDDFGAHGFDDFGAHHDQGAVNTMLEHRYGVQAPPGFTIGPMGQIVKVKAPPPPPPQDPQAAARAAKHAVSARNWHSTIAHKAVWDITGASWQIGMTVPVNQQTALDRLMADIAKKYNVFLFKAQTQAGGEHVNYVFSMAPRSAPIGGKLAGFTLKALNRPA